MTEELKIEHLRDIGLRKSKQSSFIIALPRDERDARDLSSLEEFLGVIHQKIAIYTG
jgi:hypothetical protein